MLLLCSLRSMFVRGSVSAAARPRKVNSSVKVINWGVMWQVNGSSRSAGSTPCFASVLAKTPWSARSSRRRCLCASHHGADHCPDQQGVGPGATSPADPQDRPLRPPLPGRVGERRCRIWRRLLPYLAVNTPYHPAEMAAPCQAQGGGIIPHQGE